MIDNFWSGFALGVILIISGRIIFNGIVESVKAPTINLSYTTQLPTMNSRDLSCCINQIILNNDPVYTINKISTKDENNIVTIWFNIHDKDGKIKDHVSLRCKIDDTLPDTYPLHQRKKKSIF